MPTLVVTQDKNTQLRCQIGCKIGLIWGELRSKSAKAKAAHKKNIDGYEIRSFRELLEHLGTLTRNTMRTTTEKSTATFDLVATPTPIQRRAFELLGVSVPLRLM